MLEQLMSYFSYPFVRYALLVVVLIALCSALFGVVLVLKRFSLISDGLSHVAFGALAIATVMQSTHQLMIVLVMTVISAIILLKGSAKRKIKGDASIAMLSVGALAVGYLLMNVFSSSANIAGDVCQSLFGSTSILTLREEDVILCIILAIIALAIFFLFYHKIFLVTFDESFAKATGVEVEIYQTILAVIIAVIIVIAMNLVGSLLISALVVFPVLSAMRICKSFRTVTIFSAIFSVTCAVAGILISILGKTPVGSTIVVADIIGFFLISFIGKRIA